MECCHSLSAISDTVNHLKDSSERPANTGRIRKLVKCVSERAVSMT